MSASARGLRAARPAVDLDDDASVRRYLETAVRNFEIVDLAVPVLVSVLVLVVLVVAWGVAKTASSVGDYFLVPSVISVAGLAAGGAALGPWWFHRRTRGARFVIVEPDAVVERAELTWSKVLRPGLAVPGGAPSIVRVAARLADGRLLAWTVQAPPQRAPGRRGLRAAVRPLPLPLPERRPVALLGAPEDGRFLLAVEPDGTVLWPVSPAEVVERRRAVS
jgi:hypothetical protein